MTKTGNEIDVRLQDNVNVVYHTIHYNTYYTLYLLLYLYATAYIKRYVQNKKNEIVKIKFTPFYGTHKKLITQPIIQRNINREHVKWIFHFVRGIYIILNNIRCYNLHIIIVKRMTGDIVIARARTVLKIRIFNLETYYYGAFSMIEVSSR